MNMEVGLIGTLYMEDIMTNTDFLTSYRANGYVSPINVLEQNDVSEILSELEIAYTSVRRVQCKYMELLLSRTIPLLMVPTISPTSTSHLISGEG